jgi:hypothetical protein
MCVVCVVCVCVWGGDGGQEEKEGGRVGRLLVI